MEFQWSQQSGSVDIKTVGSGRKSARKTYWKDLEGKGDFPETVSRT
jgi:hypothetical protein